MLVRKLELSGWTALAASVLLGLLYIAMSVMEIKGEHFVHWAPKLLSRYGFQAEIIFLVVTVVLFVCGLAIEKKNNASVAAAKSADESSNGSYDI